MKEENRRDKRREDKENTRRGRYGNLKIDESWCDECVKNKELEVVIKRRMLTKKGKGRISTRTLQ